MTTGSSRTPCPKCGKLLVWPTGPEKSKILIAGSFPGKDEIISGTPFVGKVGDILRAEMQRAGLNLYSCRATNLWLHEQDEKNCELNWHVGMLLKEIYGRKFVLVMGSEPTKALFHHGVMELSGMEIKTDLIPKARVFVAPIPPYIGPVGEFRLALSRFVEAVNG